MNSAIFIEKSIGLKMPVYSLLNEFIVKQNSKTKLQRGTSEMAEWRPLKIHSLIKAMKNTDKNVQNQHIQNSRN